jgi:hypothetical protein
MEETLHDSALGQWAHRISDHLMGFAQAALDAVALGLLAVLLLMALPDKAPLAALPAPPMAKAVCHVDCIETVPLQVVTLSGY